MHKPKNIIILLLIVINPVINYATDFASKGYIINKDSIRTDGFVEFFRFDATPDKIYFSEEYSGQYLAYEPESLLEFGFRDQKYISAAIDLETSSENLNTMSAYREFDLMRKHVFLEVLYQGTKNLFVYKFPDSPRKNLYYVGDIKTPNLLKRKLYLIERDLKKFKAENSEYKTQITEYLDFPKVENPDKNTIQYSTKDFNTLFLNYYNTNSVQPEYTTSFRKKKSDWYAIAGVGLNNFHDYVDEFNYSYIDGNWAPLIGVGHAFTSLNHLWTTQIEFYYNGKVSYESYNLDKKNDEYYTEYFDSASYHSFVINYYFHAPFRTKFGEVFLNGGLYGNIAAFGGSTSYTFSKFYSTEETTYNTGGGFGANGGVLLGAGLQKGKVSAELRYLLGGAKINNYDNKSVQYLQCLFSYHF